MDMVGPLPRTVSSNKYILVMCDYATKWQEAIPLKSTDSEHVADELVHLFSRVGVPDEILTDEGANFYFLSDHLSLQLDGSQTNQD